MTIVEVDRFASGGVLYDDAQNTMHRPYRWNRGSWGYTGGEFGEGTAINWYQHPKPASWEGLVLPPTPEPNDPAVLVDWIFQEAHLTGVLPTGDPAVALAMGILVIAANYNARDGSPDGTTMWDLEEHQIRVAWPMRGDGAFGSILQLGDHVRRGTEWYTYAGTTDFRSRDVTSRSGEGVISQVGIPRPGGVALIGGADYDAPWGTWVDIAVTAASAELSGIHGDATAVLAIPDAGMPFATDGELWFLGVSNLTKVTPVGESGTTTTTWPLPEGAGGDPTDAGRPYVVKLGQDHAAWIANGTLWELKGGSVSGRRLPEPLPSQVGTSWYDEAYPKFYHRLLQPVGAWRGRNLWVSSRELVTDEWGGGREVTRLHKLSYASFKLESVTAADYVWEGIQIS